MNLEDYRKVVSSGNVLIQVSFMSAGSVIGLKNSLKKAQDWDISRKNRFNILLAALYGGFIGSALPAFFAGDLVGTMAYTQILGPKTLLGGLLGSFCFVAAYKKWNRIKVKTADAFTDGTILMLAIGRIGCHFGHCCFGKAHEWGFDYGDGLDRIPIALIESSFLFLCYFLFRKYEISKKAEDHSLFIFFVIYGSARFVCEFYRENISSLYFSLNIYQWLAILLVTVGTYQIMNRTDRLFFKIQNEQNAI